MERVVLGVGGMSSVLDFLGVEKRLGRIPGVRSATVNIASNTALVEYDPTLTDVDALRGNIIDCGFHCSGEILPRHLCKT